MQWLAAVHVATSSLTALVEGVVVYWTAYRMPHKTCSNGKVGNRARQREAQMPGLRAAGLQGAGDSERNPSFGVLWIGAPDGAADVAYDPGGVLRVHGRGPAPGGDQFPVHAGGEIYSVVVGDRPEGRDDVLASGDANGGGGGHGFVGYDC